MVQDYHNISCLGANVSTIAARLEVCKLAFLLSKYDFKFMKNG